MKKKFALLTITAAMVMALAGCGEAKAPTLEELKESVSAKEPSSFEVSGSLELEGTAQLTDISESTQQMLDMLKEQMGMDLSEKLDCSVALDFEGSGESNDEYTHSVAEGKLKVSSKNDTISGLLEEAMSDVDDKFSSETYIDKDEEVKYSKESDGEWTFEDYEEDDDDSNVQDSLSAFIDYCIAHNESADEDTQIVVEKVDDEYVLKYKLVIDSDLAENIDKNERKALDQLFEDLDADVDLDAVFDFYEEYGEYADIAVPFEMELKFQDLGTKKDREFVISGVTMSLSGEVSADWDEDMVADLFEEAGNPMPDGVSFGFEFDASASVSIEAKVAYDEEQDIEIPSKVTNNAISIDDYQATAPDFNIDDDYPIDVEGGNETNVDTDSVKANPDGSYTIYNWNDEEVASFDVPDGWVVDTEYSSTSSYILKSADADVWDDFYVTYNVPAAVEGWINPDASDYAIESKDNAEKVGEAGDYQFFYIADWDEMLAVNWVDEDHSFVVSAYIRDSYDVFNSQDAFKDFVKENF